MNELTHIKEELLEISALVASVPRTNIFSVDSEYFRETEREFWVRLAADSFPEKEAHLTVPAGYFEGLAGSIMNKIRFEDQSVSEELAELSPALSVIGNDNIYSVPVGYFGNNLREAAWMPKGKVVSMFSAKQVLRYAVAAVFAGLIGLAVFMAGGNKTEKTEVPFASVMQDAQKILQTDSFEKTLNTIPEEELYAYLDTRGEDVNTAIVASYAMTTDSLPAADEYLIDENALDNFLKNNNLNN